MKGSPGSLFFRFDAKDVFARVAGTQLAAAVLIARAGAVVLFAVGHLAAAA